MVVVQNLTFIEKESIIHYQIKDIKYSNQNNKFDIKLASYFQGWPDIRVSVGYYYGLEGKGIPVAYIEGTDYRLTHVGTQHVEELAVEATNSIKDAVREINYGKIKKPKRLSIFSS